MIFELIILDLTMMVNNFFEALFSRSRRLQIGASGRKNLFIPAVFCTFAVKKKLQIRNAN
jgi:hypothetical protein